MERLPIEEVVPELVAAMAGGVAVLQAPPGAGKTTRVPLALLQAGIFEGRLVMLEPRRLAARAAAERMAEMLGEKVGQTVGYRMRGESVVSGATRIEVVTEGILTRMIQSDAELTGIGCVVFDEFHERSLNGDLGLALVQDIRSALREDLKLLVMSATLDAGPVAKMLGAPVVTSEGRAFPVETRWLDRPLPAKSRFEAEVAALITRAVTEEEGSLLVFLPGEGEIRRVAQMLRLPGIDLRPLYGALPFKEQRAAIAPSEGRKLVLATAIAETSLTIDGIRIVIDAGRARRARYDPGAGMTRLVTEPVSRAEAAQRRGRAGRVAPGVCYRMWAKAQEGALPAFPPAEIETTDLTGFALELANWGARADDLRFLTPPPAQALSEAAALLQELGAMAGGQVTAHGKGLAAIPTHPRLAHMLQSSGPKAAMVAALLSERDLLGRGAGSDLNARLKAVARPPQEINRGLLARVTQEAKRLQRFCKGPERTLGEMTALAYPDRVGLRRAGTEPRYILSGGKGAVLEAEDTLAAQRMIVALDLGGEGRDARCRLATAMTESELRAIHGDRIAWQTSCHWSKRERKIAARRQECFGALVLKDEIWRDASGAAMAQAMLDGVRDLGLQALGWSKPARLMRARVEALRAQGADMPDWSEAGLMARLEDWLAPFLTGLRDAQGLKALDPLEALKADLGWERLAELDRLAPPHLTTPLGRKIALDYSGDTPAISVRLQEMFGVTRHPTIGPKRVPVQITLLSPAQRPVQVTTDLPGFWDGSYSDVRKDMRARYPKHPWPEDPRTADPTLRAKPRKS